MSKLAVVAVGSNATRMLIADAAEGLPNERREREETRLFSGLTSSGDIARDAMRRTAEAVYKLREAALSYGAESVDLFATSATRDAKNAAEFAALVQALCGQPLCVISGEEEAALSFLGAAGRGECGVLDIGGGSTELCVGENGVLQAAVSAQMGASRLLKEYRITDAATARLTTARAKSVLENAASALHARRMPSAWRLVGGTGTTLAAMCQRLPRELAEPEGHVLARADVLGWLDNMARMTDEQKRQIVGMPPSRADIMPTGLCVLLAAMETLGLQTVTVTRRGNCDGWLMRKMAATSAV